MIKYQFAGKLKEVSFYIFIFFFPVACIRDEASQGIEPSKAISTFEIAEGFDIELIASEPLIGDPIAMEIDENGTMYVLEMHGYPMDLSGSGVVKILKDTNDDGKPDASEVFVEGLRLPTGIMRWKNGVAVTDPPNLLYFEDKDQDGRAEVRDTILTGFALSNPQHNFNTPKYGIDNWIYVANESVYTAKVFPDLFGGEGGDVFFTDFPDGPILPNNAMGRSVRLRPDKVLLENLSSYTQYGHTFDKWGRHFLVSNANHIFHEVIPANYLSRNPNLLVADATESIAEHGQAADVFPITENPRHELLTDLGVFTSACGITAYLGGSFPEEFESMTFVAEPVGNLIHADRLLENGATFTASRVYEEKEFLASRDSWFRPVSMKIGPDGALYVVDYYRQIIEHPEWMAEDVIESGELYNGTNQGRIYRISAQGDRGMDWMGTIKLGKLSSQELVDKLSDHNIWYRLNAQRLLVDRNEKSVIPLLKEKLRSEEAAVGKLHILWTLDGLEGLSENDILLGLNDPEPGIRENAIKLSEGFLSGDSELTVSLLGLKGDPNGRVRFQLLCTLGGLSGKDAAKAREDILFNDIDDSWIQIAALSAPDEMQGGLMESVLRRFKAGEKSHRSLVERLSSMLVASGKYEEVKSLIGKVISGTGRDTEIWGEAIVHGLVMGFRNVDFDNTEFSDQQAGIVSVLFEKNRSTGLKEAFVDLLRIMNFSGGSYSENDKGKALALVEEGSGNVEQRVVALRFLSMFATDQAAGIFKDRLTPNEPTEVQLASLEALGGIPGTGSCEYFLENWQVLTPELRDRAIDMFIKSEERMHLLVEAMEGGIVDPASVGWRRSVEMMAQQENEDMRNRARALFTGNSGENDREEIIEEYKSALSMEGDAGSGKIIFEKNCSICHQFGGKDGIAFGPDLKTIKNRRQESILKDILNPGLSIADGYDMWNVELKSDKVEQGIIASEATNALTLRKNGGEESVIPRNDIKSLKSMGMSLMPVGLENQISIQEMADLLAFIKSNKK
ncbi:PVC-type heme-binding CxxCH protein [Membranihabitans maritimus]|uniref:PVC-type heme-binding CxxCH protein n=1 Tax=Membranihabitans maritimus TaxID=2904244 RepID=UPI001F0053DE|nr:PVC-type heme-binding CxxCH protein [Membranihabitans maritimus]